MKSKFKARPVCLSRDDSIQAHFLTYFLSLILFRALEKRLDGRFCCEDIVGQLKDMNFKHIKGSGYIPCYTRMDFTDALHEAFGFRTDYEIAKRKQMKLKKPSKRAEIVQFHRPVQDHKILCKSTG